MVERRSPDRDFARDVVTHADALYRFACRLAGRSSVAEELVQETYARALAGQKSFQPGTDLRAWLFRILRNAFLDQRRRDKNDPTVHGMDEEALLARPVGELPRVRGDAELGHLRRLVARDIEDALSELPEIFRSVILLDLEGFTETEIAEVLDCAPGTVKSRLFRARTELRERLAEYGR